MGILGGSVEENHPFPVVSVRGNSYELGRQHGEQARPLIEGYLCLIEHLTGLPRDALCRSAMRFVPCMKALSPAFVEEISGLADGAQLSFEEAVLCQVRSEAGNGSKEGGCTAFALTGSATTGGRTLAGQNQDLRPEYAEVAIVLRIEPTDGRPRAVMVTFAGQLGYAGMNEHGVSSFHNALYDFQWKLALPHYPLKRMILEQQTVEDCVQLYRDHQVCSAGNVVLCDGDGRIADIEVRPDDIAIYTDEHPNAFLHTNHYVTPQFASLETNTLLDSCPRLDRIRSLVREHWGQITVDTLKRILADHAGDPAGICRHGADDMHSVAGYIADPDAGVIHVRGGHGCLGTWVAFEV